MRQYQCTRNNHVYMGPDDHDPGCSICAAEDAELSKTRPYYEPSPTIPMGGEPDNGKTQSFYSHLKTEVEPVVGWIVCIQGPDKGRDWRLVAGNNFIGRSAQMPVALTGDDAVSRERHAVITFEPRQQAFSISAGGGSGLVYRNGDAVVTSAPLEGHDRIELGKTTLLFVPLAGAKFAW